MVISNVHILGKRGAYHICIQGGKIKEISKEEIPSIEQNLLFAHAIAFPGLINSHDHLDFNLFPQLGNHVYRNYREWGGDIYRQNITEINAVLKVPEELRIQWGVYKNLLNGVTTVVEHGKKIPKTDQPVTVFQDCHSLHSLHYEKNWKWKLNDPFAGNRPFVIHAGEGTDDTANKEIDQLMRANLFKWKMIAVHGVAMTAKQATGFRALVWCPASNFFLLGATANIEKLKDKTKIVFGTDSTLSAGWNLWEHLRLARRQKMLNDEALFDALTKTAAEVWQMNDRGCIEEGKIADIVVAGTKGQGFASFYSINPEDILLVLHHGRIELFDSSLLEQLDSIDLHNYSRIEIQGTNKFVKGNLPRLVKRIKAYYPAVSFPFS